MLFTGRDDVVISLVYSGTYIMVVGDSDADARNDNAFLKMRIIRNYRRKN